MAGVSRLSSRAGLSCTERQAIWSCACKALQPGPEQSPLRLQPPPGLCPVLPCRGGRRWLCRRRVPSRFTLAPLAQIGGVPAKMDRNGLGMMGQGRRVRHAAAGIAMLGGLATGALAADDSNNVQILKTPQQ